LDKQVQETTQNIDYDNATIFLAVSPFNSQPAWIRVLIANRMATSGTQWGALFSYQNGGTYNNQWEIVDMKAFTTGVMPTANSGVLTIVSQIPSGVKMFDASDLLTSRGYWAGYNIPWLYEHYVALGLSNLLAKTGDQEYSFRNCSRYNIFLRDQGNVKNADDHRHMLRYNKYQTDPLSQNKPSHAIAARDDLRLPLPITYGALDAKTTAASLMTGTTVAQCCSVVTQSGPTTDNQIPFAWSTRPAWLARKPLGQPLIFNFPWTTYNLAALIPAPASELSIVAKVAIALGVLLTITAAAYLYIRHRRSTQSNSVDFTPLQHGEKRAERAAAATQYGALP
jgi:hypothetical protein